MVQKADRTGKLVAAEPDPPAFDPEEPYCFLITPFETGDEMALLRETINATVAEFGMPTMRVDEIPTGSSDSIIDTTRSAISHADFVIAVLNGARPNCYYEIGYAHAMGRPVVHVLKENEQPQFNIADLQLVRYSDLATLKRKLRTQLVRSVFSTHGAKASDDPTKGTFGRRSFRWPFRLTGRVQLLGSDDQASGASSLRYHIGVVLDSLDSKQPLKGAIEITQHPTFNPQVDRRTLRRPTQRIRHEMIAYGSFHIGVELKHYDVRLELDLTRLPGASLEFAKF